MTENSEKLNQLDDNRLIDVVKNYRQYGYTEELRNAAISLLEKRGITTEHLKLTGKFENKTYEDAKELYDSYCKSSKTAFILYCIPIFTFLSVALIEPNSDTVYAFLPIINWIIRIGFLIFLIKSFIYQSRFYKKANEEFGMLAILLFWFLGMPLYFIIYFYFRKAMREKLNNRTMYKNQILAAGVTQGYASYTSRCVSYKPATHFTHLFFAIAPSPIQK